MDSKYTEYFFALKKVWTLHVNNNFCESPDIPSGFSESLCRHLLNLDRTNSPNDACDSIDEIEIKATGTNEGKTTISQINKFDYLIWMHFDFNDNEVSLYKLPYLMFNLDGTKTRKSIRLLTIVKNNNILPNLYKFELNKT